MTRVGGGGLRGGELPVDNRGNMMLKLVLVMLGRRGCGCRNEVLTCGRGRRIGRLNRRGCMVHVVRVVVVMVVRVQRVVVCVGVMMAGCHNGLE